MKRLGFESKTIRGVKKYLIAKVDYDQHNRENKEDSNSLYPKHSEITQRGWRWCNTATFHYSFSPQ